MKRSESTALGEYLTKWDDSLTFDQVLDLLKNKGSDDDTPDDFDQRKELLTICEDYEYGNGRELVEKIKNTAISLKELDHYDFLLNTLIRIASNDRYILTDDEIVTLKNITKRDV